MKMAGEQLDERWIVRCAGMFPDDRERLGFIALRSIRAVGLKRAETIGDRKDACTERDLSSAETARVSESVPAFMMAKHEIVDRTGEWNVAQDLGSDARMNLDALELLRRQCGRFRQNVLGNRQVADVVQQGRGPYRLHICIGHSSCFGQGGRVMLD